MCDQTTVGESFSEVFYIPSIFLGNISSPNSEQTVHLTAVKCFGTGCSTCVLYLSALCPLFCSSILSFKKNQWRQSDTQAQITISGFSFQWSCLPTSNSLWKLCLLCSHFRGWKLHYFTEEHVLTLSLCLFWELNLWSK